MGASSRSVEILQGNATLRRLMGEILTQMGIRPTLCSGDEPAPSTLSDLLVVDVDSGVPNARERAQSYFDDHRHVIFCGVRGSRDEFEDQHWLGRPFTPATFISQCVLALGLLEEDSKGGATPPNLLMKGDEPITRELAYDEAQELERRLGLNPGSLASPSEVTGGSEDAFEVLDVESSFIEEVDELNFSLGGSVVGEVSTRRVSVDEIALSQDEEIRVSRQARSPTFNQTMPDTPMALSPDETSDVSEHGRSSDSSQPAADIVPKSGEAGDIGFQIKGVARMLAESWHRIAMTPRTDDRADRIEKILVAAVGKGIRGAAKELERVPQAAGFAGNFAALTFVDTIRTIRDRKLRGRLEVAIGDEAFVFYVEGMYLHDIDALSGNIDGMLLEILHQGGAVDAKTFEQLRTDLDDGRLNAPLEMILSRRGLVADATLQSAKVVRAREIFRRLCGTRGGQFAFLEIVHGDGQPWPVDSLRINVDQLMLELLREASIDTGDSKATDRTMLQLDATRAASVDRLTPAEREVLDIFRTGETLESARERLQAHAGPEDVERIVDRLKKVELLKRSNPQIEVSDEIRERVTRQSSVVEPAPGVESSAELRLDEGSSPVEEDVATVGRKPSYEVAEDQLGKEPATVGSRASYELARDESESEETVGRKQSFEMTGGDLAEPTESESVERKQSSRLSSQRGKESGKAHEAETVGKRPNFDMDPSPFDTGEVDALVEEAMLAYEKSIAEESDPDDA